MKFKLSIISLTILLSLCTIGHCHRILGIFPLNSKSSFTVFEGLMKSLADRGHQVDVVSSFPLKQSYDNYHDIIHLPETSPSLTNNVTYADIHKKMGSVLSMVKSERGNDVCQALANSDLMNLINNPPKDIPYDVVITEMLIANCFMVVGHYLQVPVIGVSTYGRLPWVYDIMGNPEHPSFHSNDVSHQFYLGFWQRIKSFFRDSYDKWSFYRGTQAQDGILRNIFGKKAPKVRELESSVALALTNSHFLSHGPAPVVPGLVEVGGMHISEERIEPLYIDILDFLDTSKHGAVYVNLGEDLLFETLPEHIIKAFYTAFENIRPIRVLLRTRDFDSLPPGIPPNVVTVPWVQQYRVLQHPNTRVFVTHGGLLGVQEAMAAGTVMLGIPLGGDQFENVDMIVKNDLGMRLDLDSITVETFGHALNHTLKNPIYRQKSQEMMEKFFDRPELPVDTACFWIEYVIRHGSSSLKSPLMKLSWFQSSYFDIFGFFSFVTFMIIFLTIFFVKRIVMSIVSKLKTKPKSKKLL